MGSKLADELRSDAKAHGWGDGHDRLVRAAAALDAAEEAIEALKHHRLCTCKACHLARHALSLISEESDGQS